ncbi:thioredoxin family protein [bacterium]|nr:thioredoxin family protein [bacterium]
MNNPYFDKRQEFFKSYFELAQTYEEYLKTAEPAHRARWDTFKSKITINSEQKAVLKSFIRELNILVMSGTWCGDCARQGPMFAQLEAINPKLRFRFIDNKQNPDLQNELRINGAEKVPVVVVLSEDYYEIARFGDRHLSVYRRKLISELGAACDPGIIPPSGEELSTEVTEWVNFLERAHALLRLAPLLRRRYND